MSIPVIIPKTRAVVLIAEADELDPPVCYTCHGLQPMEPWPLMIRSETLPKWWCPKCKSIFNSRGEYRGMGTHNPDPDDGFSRWVKRMVAERGERAVAESVGIDYDALRPIPQISGDTTGSLPRLRRVSGAS